MNDVCPITANVTRYVKLFELALLQSSTGVKIPARAPASPLPALVPLKPANRANKTWMTGCYVLNQRAQSIKN